MDNFTSKLLDETAALVERYNKDLSFQHKLDQILDNPQISLRRIMYRGRPLKLYTDIISRTLYWKYREYQQMIKSSPQETKDLFRKCYNQRDLSYLTSAKAQSNRIFSPEEQQEINRIEQLPPEQRPKEFKKVLEKSGSLPPPSPKNQTVEKIQQQEKGVGKIGGVEDGEEDIEIGDEEQPPPSNLPRMNWKRPQLPVQAERVIAKYTQPGRLVSFLSTPLRLLRQVINGGGNLALRGVAKGGGKAFQGGLRVLDSLAAASRGGVTKTVAARGAIAFLVANPIVLAGIIVLVGIPLLTFFILIMTQSAPFNNPYTGSGATTITSDISQCSFRRSDQNPPGARFKSPLLLSYFQEASRLSGVPTAVLAAIARVESPSSAYKTDADLISLGCPKSETGALGLMQIQPAGTLGYSPDSIDLGAKFLNTTINKLTEADYCDPQKSIILASGFIIKKMQYLYGGNGLNWNPAWNNDKEAINVLATGYYGCLNYGGTNPLKCEGPYSYGADLWASIQDCRVSSIISNLPPVSCPVPGGKITTPSYQVNPTTGHCGDSYGYTCTCKTSGRRAKAIDIVTGGPNGQDVVLPTINNQIVNWQFIQTFPVDSGEGGGSGYEFEAITKTERWYLQLLHMGSTPLSINTTYPSSTVVGKTAINHVHATIGKNIQNPLSSGNEITDCDPGWLASDFMCSAQ